MDTEDDVVIGLATAVVAIGMTTALPSISACASGVGLTTTAFPPISACAVGVGLTTTKVLGTCIRCCSRYLHRRKMDKEREIKMEKKKKRKNEYEKERKKIDR